MPPHHRPDYAAGFRHGLPADDILRLESTGRFQAAAEAELAAVRPPSDNGYKVTLAGNLIQAVLSEQRVRIDGRLRAIHHHAAYALSPLAEYFEGCTDQARALYAAPAIRTELTAVPLDILPPASMRGPGATPGSFAFEAVLERALGEEMNDHLGYESGDRDGSGSVAIHVGRHARCSQVGRVFGVGVFAPWVQPPEEPS